MRKIVLYIAQSLDGYIATNDGGVEWLNSTESNEADSNAYGYLDFLDTIDITLMGYKTYKAVVDFGIPFPYPDKTNFVFSRNHQNVENNPVTFIDEDAVQFVRNLKATEGKDIWLIGGGEINRILLNADLVDQIIVTILPVILGSGIPMFADGTDFKRFRVETINHYDGSLVQLIISANHS